MSKRAIDAMMNLKCGQGCVPDMSLYSHVYRSRVEDTGSTRSTLLIAGGIGLILVVCLVMSAASFIFLNDIAIAFGYNSSDQMLGSIRGTTQET
jgi:hypothetical protein